MDEARKRGIYENFGQNDIRRLRNKYADFRYGTPSQRRAYEKIEKLDEWAMTYNGRNR
jgi:hypothetical protein